MVNKKIKFNVFFNNDGEELEELVIQALISYLNSKNSLGLNKC